MLSRYIQFSQAISAIYKNIQKLERKEMETYGLRGGHVRCLVTVNAHPEGITAAQLSILCEKNKAAISRSLQELEQKGLLLRESGYRANLSLTPQGKALVERITCTAEQAVQAVSTHLQDEQRPLFYEVLDQISQDLENMCRQGIPGERKEYENKNYD